MKPLEHLALTFRSRQQHEISCQRPPPRIDSTLEPRMRHSFTRQASERSHVLRVQPRTFKIQDTKKIIYGRMLNQYHRKAVASRGPRDCNVREIEPRHGNRPQPTPESGVRPPHPATDPQATYPKQAKGAIQTTNLTRNASPPKPSLVSRTPTRQRRTPART